jgi:TonB family protein
LEPVTSVLLARGQEPQGLRKMLAASLTLHVVAAIALVVSPMLWRPGAAVDVTPVMTISLGGGAPGPMSGGMNPMGGRPVQTTEPATRPEAVRPPAARTPAMTLPVPKGKPLPKTSASSTVEEGRGTTPARGARINQGAAFGETGGEGTGSGLSTGGLGGDVGLDVSNFCCPEYLSLMTTSIKRNWDPNQPVAGSVIIRFTVLKDGRLADISVFQPSGYQVLDWAAQRAVSVTAKLPPLPAEFPSDHLTVRLRFQYEAKR